MSKEAIYKALINAGMTATGACAMMGNMQAESALRSNNAQDGMTKMSDDEYTAAVDNGSYGNFVRDSVGYGLCQWTYWSRKQALYNYAKQKGKSIGDATMQTEFCIKELKEGYSSLWSYLCSTNDLYTATSRICTEFERPAVNNIEARYNFAKALFAELSTVNTTAATAKDTATVTVATAATTENSNNVLKDKLTNETVFHLQSILKTYGYDIGKSGIDGYIGNNTKAALKKFVADIEAV